MAELELTALRKSYGSTAALESLDLTVADGELVTLLGPSGSGKTTALRLIAGFLQPDHGEIRVGGRDVTGLPPERRDIGMVFQSYALFPHRNVFRNVAFGLERRTTPPAERETRVARALARVQLEALATRMPSELSGGQQQRVALARALVIEPTLLLLDEPLSNLDAGLRVELRAEIRHIQRELGITTVLVTHDQEEALSISDRIAVLHDGRVQQVGDPDSLYHRPENRFVAEFVGKMNLFEADRVSEHTYRLNDGTVIQVPGPVGPGRALLGVRPERVRLAAAGDRNRVLAKRTARVFLGELTEQSFELQGGATVLSRATASTAGPLGETVELAWPVEATLVLER